MKLLIGAFLGCTVFRLPFAAIITFPVISTQRKRQSASLDASCRTCRLASGWVEPVVGRGRQSSRAGGRRGRRARLSDAIKFRGLTMVFSWPSKAGLFEYAYDRESAMFFRDDFDRVLSSIVSAPAASRIHIVAHSMGTMLTLESLRQLHTRYGGAVVSAAPDIHMDVFSSAISRIGPLAGKITVITSTNDRALALLRANVAGMYRLVFVVGGRLARDVNQFRRLIDR